MIIRYKEEYALPVGDGFAYVRTLGDWCRLLSFGGEAEVRDDGWYAVPLKGFPIPLVARYSELKTYS